MRTPNPRIVRLAALTRGAILERGDGEGFVSPQFENVLEISSPIDKILTPPTGSRDDSFSTGGVTTKVGAQVAASLVLCTFTKGLWRLTLNFSAAFTGTTNGANASQFQLGDPDGVLLALFNLPHISNCFLAASTSFWIVFQRDGWTLQTSTAATVALDVLAISGQVIAARSL